RRYAPPQHSSTPALSMSSSSPPSFSLPSHLIHPPLLSSPTRRSSDLRARLVQLFGARHPHGARVRHAVTHSLRDERGRHAGAERSEEHTSELQSPDHLVCRLLLEKKK